MQANDLLELFLAFRLNRSGIVGLLGIEVSKPEDIGPAWDQALSAPRPTVLEMHTDPKCRQSRHTFV
jgi:hypothetical protein